MPFTVTAEVPFHVKDTQYLCIYLSPSEHCGIPVRLRDDKQPMAPDTSSVQVNSSSTGTT